MGLFDKSGKQSEEFRVGTSNAPPTTAEIAPAPEAVAEAKNDFSKSADALEEARAGRNLSDIPLNDVYWNLQNVHTLAHGTHPVREDKLDTIKGKPLTEDQKKEVVK